MPLRARQTTRANSAKLTLRELEVLRLSAGGVRSVDVAERLVLSRRTSSTTSAAIVRELKARTRDEGAAATVGLFQDR